MITVISKHTKSKIWLNQCHGDVRFCQACTGFSLAGEAGDATFLSLFLSPIFSFSSLLIHIHISNIHIQSSSFIHPAMTSRSLRSAKHHHEPSPATGSFTSDVEGESPVRFVVFSITKISRCPRRVPIAVVVVVPIPAPTTPRPSGVPTITRRSDYGAST